MPLLHAKVFSPSASKTWLKCAGAPLAQEGVPNKSSEAAEEGTAAHSLGETVLSDNDLNCDDFIGVVIHTTPADTITDDETLPGREWTVDKEMASYVQEYVDYCRSFMTEDSDSFVEVASDFGEWVDDEALAVSGKAWGTSDMVIASPGVLHVFDLKYGMGIKVVAEGNSQALIYALGVYAIHDWMYDFKEVTVHIIQPRKGGVSKWTISVDELMAFGDTVRQATSLIAQPDPIRTAGDDQCEWCRARTECVTRTEYMVDLLSEGFADEPEALRDDSKVSNDLLGEIVLRASAVTKWLKESKEVALERMRAGETFTNIKPVTGRGSYSYADADKAESSLVRMCGIDVAKPRQLVTVAVAKKLKTKDGKLMADNVRWNKTHVKRNEGNITLAAISDKREAVNVNVVGETDEWD